MEEKVKEKSSEKKDPPNKISEKKVSEKTAVTEKKEYGSNK